MNARRQYDIEVRGSKVHLGERTLVMGVVNVTPDSFSDGGRFLDPGRAIEQALMMVREGADWIEVGGESTRPGAKPVDAAEELRRVLPAIRGASRKLRSVPISIDTTKALVAEEAIRAGASVINDVSGLRFDPRIAGVARQHRVPLILMHLRGRPETMQRRPFAKSAWSSVLAGLRTSIRRALVAGVPRSQLVLDPGLGFGKTRRQNFEIIARLDRLSQFRLPILVGTSRKSFVQSVAAGEGLDRRAKGKSLWPMSNQRGHGVAAELIAGGAAMVAASILAGAHIVRVHDVKAILPAVRIADALLETAR
ncbi:MAG: dihydropteroate synthase [Deltaproteobacteria bacterium]